MFLLVGKVFVAGAFCIIDMVFWEVAKLFWIVVTMSGVVARVF